jgi:hypothetical protein
MDEHEILEAHHVRVRGDNPWQRRARLMQALWRERVGLPAGDHRGSPLGSRITPADGEPPANQLLGAAAAGASTSKLV